MTTAVRKPNVGCIMEQMEQPGEACLSLCRGKFLELLKEGRWEYVRRVNASGAVMIVAVTKEGELLLVEEYRVPLHARTVGLPAGISGDEGEESTLQSARRELEEETGYRADSWTFFPRIDYGNGILLSGGRPASNIGRRRCGPRKYYCAPHSSSSGA